MNIIYFLMPLALLLALSFVASFLTAALRGQYDDLETPAHRMLLNDDLQNSDLLDDNLLTADRDAKRIEK
jgi:cbb3-type cytochrome oxidase maturation protein